MVKIAVLISGGGTNLQALIDATKANQLNGEIVLVASNRKNAFGLTRAQNSLPWAWVSGIISSLITYSIVPPAKASANGRIVAEKLTK